MFKIFNKLFIKILDRGYFFLSNYEGYILFTSKKFRFLENPFPLINDGIIVLASIGSKKLNITEPR